MYEMFEDEAYLYMVTELVPAKDALEMLHSHKYISEELAMEVFYQLLLAVNYLHAAKVMHRYALLTQGYQAGKYHLPLTHQIPQTT